MNTNLKDTAKLINTINAALAALDLKGSDQQITRAMTIVTEAFLLYKEGRFPTTTELISKAEAVADESRLYL